VPAGKLARPSGLPEDQDRRLIEVHITTVTLFAPDAPPWRVLNRGRGREPRCRVPGGRVKISG
jgi:hypothetical protein